MGATLKSPDPTPSYHYLTFGKKAKAKTNPSTPILLATLGMVVLLIKLAGSPLKRGRASTRHSQGTGNVSRGHFHFSLQPLEAVPASQVGAGKSL